MKNRKLFFSLFFLMGIFCISSCGPVVISSRPSSPPPPWFYPNRLEVVRYVYFPEHSIYYDLTTQYYLYLDSGSWVRVKVLPPHYRSIDLRRSKYLRIRNYYDDNISRYHEENNINRRSNVSKPSRRRN